MLVLIVLRETKMVATTVTVLQLFLVFFVFAYQQEKIPSECRISRKNILACEGYVPDTIPRGVVGVFISNYLQTNISNNTFTDLNWRTVKILDININTVVDFTLADFNFYNLYNVEVLGVHSRRLDYIPNTILNGLHSLRTLDFSECSSLSISKLVNALLSYPRALEYLKLDQVGIRSITIDDNFIAMTAIKRISKLSLSGTNIFARGPIKCTGKEASLKYIDISNSTILPSNSYSYDDKYIMFTKVLRNVEVLNVSSMPYSFLDFDFTAIEKLNGKDCVRVFRESSKESEFNNIFQNIKVLEMNDLFKYKIILKNSIVNLTCIRQMNLRTVSMKKNNLQWANITLLLPPDLAIKELDLSSNKLRYLSPELMKAFSHLQILNLANNSLGFMETYEEFSNIFVEQRNVTDLNMAFNSLKNLPGNIFINNEKVRYLDLCGNKLNKVSFKFQHLRNLITLNLSFNEIISFDKTTVELFGNFLNIIAMNRNKTAYIDLTENPLVCNCETVGFIEWLLTDLTLKHNQSYSCLYEGDIVIIDKRIIKKSKFLCYRTIVIVISVILFLTTTTIISIVVVKAHNRSKAKKRRLTRDKFIEMFLANEINKNSICFVAYASEDVDVLSKLFCRCLDYSLQEYFRTDRRLISTGDLDIAPGYPIMDEVLKCVSGACSLIVITSRKFCESDWCQTELREAYNLNIPIILLFKEDVAEHLMSPIMLAVFKRFTRAKLIAKDDSFDTVPEWKLFIESVINLASDCNYDIQ